LTVHRTAIWMPAKEASIFIKIRLDFRLRENDKMKLRRLGIGRTSSRRLRQP
jgi:hypothetical protein